MTHPASTTNAMPRHAQATEQTHATTARSTTHERFKITNVTAHPCITIRRGCEGPPRGRCESISERRFVDLEGWAPPC
jgi:hypothetical protein